MTGQCLPGTAPKQIDGEAVCEPCAAGWHGTREELTGLRSCVQCTPNTLQPFTGQVECVECPADGVECAVQDRVEVLPGWYRPVDPLGAADDGDLSHRDNVTYMFSPLRLEPVRCSREGCMGGANLSDASCAEGHTGPLCGACFEGWYMGQDGCSLCEVDASSGSSSLASMISISASSFAGFVVSSTLGSM